MMEANDVVEQREGAPISVEGDLSQSSTPLLGSPEMILPRSLEPIIRVAADPETGTT
jgi:hypothetical protein